MGDSGYLFWLGGPQLGENQTPVKINGTAHRQIPLSEKELQMMPELPIWQLEASISWTQATGKSFESF
jgi:hypothetical protein